MGDIHPLRASSRFSRPPPSEGRSILVLKCKAKYATVQPYMYQVPPNPCVAMNPLHATSAAATAHSDLHPSERPSAGEKVPKRNCQQWSNPPGDGSLGKPSPASARDTGKTAPLMPNSTATISIPPSLSISVYQRSLVAPARFFHRQQPPHHPESFALQTE